MTIASSKAEEALSPGGESPANDTRPAAAKSLLDHLRAAWAEYLAENRRGWGEIVDDQAKSPSLD